MAAALVLAQLRAQMALPAYAAAPTLGLLYITDHYANDARELLDYLASELPEVTDWSGTVGVGVSANNAEYFDEPALSVMLLDVPADTDNVIMKVGSDDYMKIWINGKIVFVYNKERRASDWDQNIVKGISLKKGLNRIVVKCVNIVGGWNMYVRFTDADGLPFRVEADR